MFRPPLFRLLVTATLAAAVSAVCAPGASAAAGPVRWCGNDIAQGDRVPDRVAGSQIHAVYAIPANGGDRFAAAASAIATDLAAIDAWWQAQDPTRAPRFDLFSFPRCESTFGLLDISFVRLPQPAAHYDQADARKVAALMFADLYKRFSHRHKRYLVYYDGPTQDIDACGLGSEEAGYAWVFLQPPPGCPPVDLGEARFTAMVAAHEIVHLLGALPGGAPHGCPANEGHPCDDPRDIIYGIPIDAPLGDLLLDVGADDYYGHAGSWWDVQDSPWLRRLGEPEYRLSVLAEGKGGTVTSDLPGIDCPRDCNALLERGTRVTLTAMPDYGRRFLRWGGACAGRFVCTVTMDRARTVTAVFGPAPTASRSGRGRLAPDGRQGLLVTFTLSKRTFQLGEPLTLTATTTVGAKVTWNFGDGSTATGTYVRHQYKRTGAFTITVSITDAGGATGSAWRSLRVVDPRPRVAAFPGYAYRGSLTSLSYTVADNRPPTRALLEVFRGRRAVVRRSVRLSGVTSYGNFAWRTPRSTGHYRWCVRVWDESGNASNRSCSSLQLI